MISDGYDVDSTKGPSGDNGDAGDLRSAGQRVGAPHPARTYRILVSDENLTFSAVQVADPLPLGRQVLEAAGARPVEEFSLFALLPNGDFEDVRLDEPFDLRGHGAERFTFFRTDRSFKFTIDNRQLDWGKPLITGMVLRRLANIQPGYALYLEVRGGQDREIGDIDVVDLSQQGIERFITVIRETTEGLIALPTMDQSYLDNHLIEYELVSDGGHVGVILKKMPLPEGKFDHASADVLILLPTGYPDACPDMFFFLPWVRLSASMTFPKAADAAHAFRGQKWQRWSRHSRAWRSGVDGLHTMIARVRHAVETAR